VATFGYNLKIFNIVVALLMYRNNMKKRILKRIDAKTGLLIGYYQSVKEAADDMNISENLISQNLKSNNSTKHCRGSRFEWESVNDESKKMYQPVWLPKCLLKKLLEELETNKPFFSYKLDYFVWILSVVITKYYVNPEDSGKPVEISFDLLKKNYYGKVYMYRDWLIDSKLLIQNRSGGLQSEIKYCGMYSISAQNLTGEVEMVLIKQKKLAQNIINYRSGISKENKDQIRAQLIKKLNNFYLDISENETKMLVNKIVKQKLASCSADPEVLKCIYLMQLCSARNSLQVFNPCDGFGNRFHSTMTYIKRELRNYLKIDGYEGNIIEIDIANSQPYCLSLALCHNFVKSHHHHLFAEFWEVISKFYNNHKNESSDVAKYKRLCSEGVFYDYLIQCYNKKYGSVIDRDTFKIEIFKHVFFGDINKKYTNKLKKLFLNEFPRIYLLINELKSLSASKDAFCSLLQKIESYYLIDTVATQLIDNFDTNLATIHDSIICKESDKELVQETLLITLKNWRVENMPKLKIKVLKPLNLE